MLKKDVTRKDWNLTIVLSGHTANYQIEQTIGLLCRDIVGISEGKTTRTGIFKRAEFGDSSGGGCAVVENSLLTARYGGKDYNILVQSDSSEVLLNIRRSDGKPIPDTLYERVNAVFEKYLAQQNKEKLK